MVAVKPSDVDAFLGRLDKAPPVVLVFGPDAGLVSERVSAVIAAQTIPLFGGRRAVWVKAGSRNIAPAVEDLLGLPACECRVVIEAGDLRRNAPLRALCERAKNAAALPCYTDSERDLGRLVDSEMRAAGLTLAPDARALLLPLLGGDRAASRSELRKLILYAAGSGTVGIDEVTAVVSDASALALDDLVDAAFAGRPADLETQLAKARAAGSAVGSIFFAAQRHKWRTAIEAGGGRFSVDALLPPVHFRRKNLVDVALRQWNAARLAAAMADLADAALASRRTPALAETIAERALLSLAMRARRAAA
jgi:DNA polymerase-3 subunit delta